MIKSKEIESAVQGWLDGSLSDAEANALREWLDGDRRRVEWFVAQLDIHDGLQEAQTNLPANISAIQEDWRRRQRKAWAWRVIPITVAAAIAAIWLMADASLVKREAYLRERAVVARVEEGRGEATTEESEARRRVGRGDKVREGERIEVGEKEKVVLVYTVPSSPDGLRRGTWARVELDAGSILSMRPMSPKGPTSPISKLEKGILTAHVEKRSVFAVLTPHARVEVLGTKFELRVDEKRTRLGVFEGLTQFTRLSDGKAIEVAAGQYAVAAEGVKLAALALPDRPARKAMADAPRPKWTVGGLGEIIFDDDMNGIDNWDIVIGSPEGEYEVVTVNPERYWEMGSEFYSGKEDKMVVVKPRHEENRDRCGGIRLKKPIDAERFVIEARMSFRGLGLDTAILTEGLETREEDSVLIATWESYPCSRNRALFRWEFAPAKRAPSEGMLVRRFFYHYKCRNISYIRPTSRKILLVFSNLDACIYHVRVRRLPEDYDVE